MPSPWFDFWPKVALAVVNSVALGVAALAAAYWFNRQLERHKRNEAITAELGKQSLAAYLRILSVVGDVNGFMAFAELALHGDEPSREKRSGKAPHPFGDSDKVLEAAFREIFKSGSLVNVTFAQAAIGFLGFASRYLDEYESPPPITEPAREKLLAQRLALLQAVGAALPAYVRLPDEAIFQFTRSLDDLLVGVGMWERDESGNVRVVE
jgi:hypothetical protein